MERYSEYKDSGVEWIGKIPNSWALQRINNVFTERTEKVSDLDYEPLSVTKNGIFPQLENVAKSDNHDNRKLVKNGDFVINSRSDRRGSSGMSNLDGSVSLINIVITPKKNIKPKYSELIFKSYEFINEYYRNGRGIVADLWSTRYALMKNISICIPPLKEQEQIVAYLDDKTAKIDDLLAKTKKKIELLKEKRTSLINHCITKGLKPSASMKDSGVEWIEDIPSEWNRSRLDFLFRLYGRLGWKSLKSDEYVEEGYVFLSTPNIKGNKIDYKNANYITKERYNESPEIMLENGDVLLVKDGSTLGIVNLVRNLLRPSTVNSSIGVLKKRSNKISPNFMYYHLSSYYHQNIINRIKGGMGVPHLFQSDIKKFIVILPSLKDQQGIVEYLDEQTSKIDSTISKVEKRIVLLKEYRQSLISNVVTGKIKVCN